MAHTAVYGMTRIQVTMDAADTSDWVSARPVRVRNWGFAPYQANDYVFAGEYQASGVIVGMPLKSTSGDPIGERWDTDDDYITVAIDTSKSNINGETVVVFNHAKE